MIGDRHLVKRSQDDRDRKNAIFLAIFAAINIIINFSRIMHFETKKQTGSVTLIEDG